MGNIISSYLKGPVGREATLGDAEAHRRKASELAARHHELSQRSQAAYRAGNGSLAKGLSAQSHEVYQQMEAENREAAQLLLAHHNRDSPRGTLDLHGLFVKEALPAVRDHLKRGRTEKWDEAILIVGAGNHSKDGVQRIKPAVEKYLREAKYRWSEVNPGCLRIYLKDSPPRCCVIC